MGKKEADVDGIKYYYNPERRARGTVGNWVYCIPCELCGETIESLSYSRTKNYICDRCRLGVRKKKDAIAEAWLNEIETKGERRFNKALDNIQSQVRNFDEYEQAIKIARKGQDRYGSIPEAMVAVELSRLGYKIIPQQKVGRYNVDFFLPEQKWIIEVDGELYHKDKKNSDREAIIQLTVGLDYQIIHIPAELISKDIRKLKKCIDEILNYRKNNI